MFTSSDYLYGWLVYVAAALAFFACWWYLTRNIRLAEVRAILRVGAIVTMFLPWYVAPDSDYLAPAVLMAGMEGLFDGPGAFWRAGGPLLVVLGITIIGSLVFTITRRLLARKRAAPTQDVAPEAGKGAG